MVQEISGYNESEMLKYALTRGMIDLNAVQEQMINEQKQHYLGQHKYKIFQDKDGRWKTTLPNKDKRRLVAKKNLEDLENTIVEFYKDFDFETNTPRLSKDITLEELYPIWLQSRLLESKMVTVKRNDQEWRRYYQGTNITKIPMRLLTINQLKDWAHDLINKNEFNKRDYYDMALIIKKCFEFAADEGICENTWGIAKTKVNTKKLKKMKKKENDTEIYFFDEKAKLIAHALKRYAEKPWNIGVLAIPFLFLSGMRISEVVALKYSNLCDNEIHVDEAEINTYMYDENKAEFKYLGKTVENHTKSEAGIRTIPYTSDAKKIIGLVKKASIQYNYCDNDYVFCPASKRLTSNSIDKLLYRYCEEVGISRKSAHKIRKTYISQLIIGGIDLDTVCRVSGHVDLKTTLQSYLYSLDRKTETYSKFEDIFQNTIL